VAQRSNATRSSILVSGTRDSLKIWKIYEDNSQINQIKLLRMCSTTLNDVSSDPESDPEYEDNEEGLKDAEDDLTLEKETPTKKSCLLQ